MYTTKTVLYILFSLNLNLLYICHTQPLAADKMYWQSGELSFFTTEMHVPTVLNMSKTMRGKKNKMEMFCLSTSTEG